MARLRATTELVVAELTASYFTWLKNVRAMGFAAVMSHRAHEEVPRIEDQGGYALGSLLVADGVDQRRQPGIASLTESLSPVFSGV